MARSLRWRTTPEWWVGMAIILVAIALWTYATWRVREPASEAQARRIAERHAHEPLSPEPGRAVADGERKLWAFDALPRNGVHTTYRVNEWPPSFEGYERTGLPPLGPAISEQRAMDIAVAEAKRRYGGRLDRTSWVTRQYRSGEWWVTTPAPGHPLLIRHWRPTSLPPFITVRMRPDGSIVDYSQGSTSRIEWAFPAAMLQCLGALVVATGAVVRAIVRRRRRIAGETTAPLR